ncbi:MAG: rRNA maturation RNase YbeY [Candidatus Omnitrophota bacterium]
MKITIKNLQNKIKIQPQKIKNLINKVLKDEKIKKTGYLNICLVNNSIIKKFNKKFHKTNLATDVLAFDSSNINKNIQADIMVSTEMAIRQAKIFKTNANYELSLYLVHGVLHILGYNDQNKKQIKIMRQTESKYVH